MNLDKNKTNAYTIDVSQLTSKNFIWTMHLLALVALVLSIYLSKITLSGAEALGCNGDSGQNCNAILSSTWAYWMGIPVTLAALISYSAIFIGLICTRPGLPETVRRMAWSGIFLLLIIASGTALWFINVQIFILKGFCIYCTIIHGCGLLMTIILIKNLLTHNRVFFSGNSFLMLAAIGITGTIVLIAGQLWSGNDNEPYSSQETIETQPSRDISFGNGQLSFNSDDVIIIGSPDAEHFIGMMFDYTCSHCRILHDFMLKAKKRYKDQIAIVLLPVPLNNDCNPRVKKTPDRHIDACSYAKLALAIWQAKRSEFEKFDAYLSYDSNPPSVKEARNIAITLLGDENKLNEALAHPDVNRMLQTSVNAYQSLPKSVIPKMLLSTKMMDGRTRTASDLFHFLEEELGVVNKSE